MSELLRAARGQGAGGGRPEGVGGPPAGSEARGFGLGSARPGQPGRLGACSGPTAVAEGRPRGC